MYRGSIVFIIALAIFNLGGAHLSEQAPQNPVLSKYFIVPESEAQMQQIGDVFSVDHPHGGGYEVYVPIDKKEDFLRLAPKALLLESDISNHFRRMDPKDLKGFHNFDSVKTHLEKIVADYPDLAMLDTYGKSMEGRPLYVLRILSKNGPSKKAQIAISSSTHGNEISTVEVVFGIIEHLVKNYGRDSRITSLVDSHELYFLPVINPDGYVRKERYANGIDPNRDYPWPEMPNRNPNPCIKAVMGFYAAHDIKASIDYHSAASMIMYPWAYTYNSVGQDEAEFRAVTGKMAKLNGYAFGQISKIIYVAKGSSADYYYWKFGTRALGIELSREGSSSIIPELVRENLESTLAFIESY